MQLLLPRLAIKCLLVWQGSPLGLAFWQARKFFRNSTGKYFHALPSCIFSFFPPETLKYHRTVTLIVE